MEKTYWKMFVLAMAGFALIVPAIVWLIIVAVQGNIRIELIVVAVASLLFALTLALHMAIPCLKDFRIVYGKRLFEEDAEVVEFTKIDDSPKKYTHPKFFIREKTKFVVLDMDNVEFGKKYRIRYLPNTKLCEVLYCLDEQSQ